jgi:hypothetical protein
MRGRTSIWLTPLLPQPPVAAGRLRLRPSLYHGCCLVNRLNGDSSIFGPTCRINESVPSFFRPFFSLTLQSFSVQSAELDTPKADRFSGYCDASLGQEIFDIAVTQVEAISGPDGIGNDVWWKSVAFVVIHPPILAMSASLFGNTR